MPSHNKGLITATVSILALAGLGAVGARAWADTTTTRMTRVPVATTTIHDFSVLQITDVHDMPMERQLDRIVEFARDARPTVIVLTGDLVNTDTSDLRRLDRFVSGLESTGIPLFAVEGNHDYWNARHDDLCDLLTRHGVRILHDETVPLDGPWGRVDLVGVDDYFSGRGDARKAAATARPDAFRLVATHAPQIADDLPDTRADYAFCGHTHGGQVALPGGQGLWVPRQGILPELDHGLHDIGGVPLYINTGVGTTGPRFRFLVPSRVVLFEFGG